MSVDTVPVSDVLELQRRQVRVEPDVRYTEIGLRSFGRGVFHKDPVTGQELGGKRVFHIHPGDLLVSNVFGWEGAVAVAGPDESGLIGSHRFMTWTPVDDAVDVRYAQHYLLSDAGIESLRRASPGSAGRNRTLNKAKFEAIRIPLPSIEDQRRIATRLSAMAEPVEALPGAAAMESWVSALRNQLVSGVSAEGRVIGDVLRPCREWQTIDDNASYVTVGVRGFGRGIFHYEPVLGSGLGKLRYASLRPGRLVVSNIKAWEGAVAVAGHAESSCLASNRFLQYEATDGDVVVDFIRHYLLSEPGNAQLQRASPGSADRNRTLSMDSFESIRIPLPSREAQEYVSHRMASAARLLELTGRRATLAAALLPAARNEVFSRLG